MLSDIAYKELVTSLREGRPKSIETLYDNYAGSLYGVILKITPDQTLAQDILQETFVKIWRNIDSYNPDQSRLFTWMMRIARNTAINKVQSKAQRKSAITEGDIHLRTIATKSNNDDHIDIDRLLNNLDTKYKSVLELVYLQGLTHKEASDQLDLPLGTVKSRIKIGLRHLRSVYNYMSPSLTVTTVTLILIFF